MHYDWLLQDSRAAPLRNGATEKLPSTPFPGRGHCVDGHGDYTYSSSYTKIKYAPPHPVHRLAETFPTAMLAFKPRNLLTSCTHEHEPNSTLSAERKKSAFHGVWLSRTPDRRRHPDRTVTNLSDSRVRIRNILHFLPVTRYFLGTTVGAPILPVIISGICSKMR